MSETVTWNCPKCFTLNTQYPDPLPSIAECKQCGHGIDLDKHLKIQKALATHDYEALDDLSEQAVKS